jgi:uncharacterized membrane protein
MLCLFQENESYGVRTICIHTLMHVTVRQYITSGTITALSLLFYLNTLYNMHSSKVSPLYSIMSLRGSKKRLL